MMEKKFDITAMGELLIDFAPAGKSDTGMKLFEQNPGGAPANMLAAAKMVGLSVAFMGKVGADMHGIYLESVLEGAGIDTRALVIDEGYFTTMAFVTLAENGERRFSFARKPGADTMFNVGDIDKDLLKNSKVFHVGSLSLTDEPARSATYEAVRFAKEHGVTISYDPNYRDPLWESEETAKELMKSLVPFADMMKISDEETDLLTPYKEPEQAAKYLLSQGVRVVGVTLGAEGVLVASKDGMTIVPGFKSNVVDTTGAGDSFWGSFVAKLIEMDVNLNTVSTEQLVEAARFGNAVASLCVEKRGGISGIPSREEVDARLKRG